MRIAADDVINAVVALVPEFAADIHRERNFSWVGWGDKIKSRGAIPGVTKIYIQPPDGDTRWITVTVDAGLDSDFSSLGYAYLPRDGGRSSVNNFHGPRRLIWDLAYGYVNGFPMRDVAYYLLTRVVKKYKYASPNTK